MSMTRDYQKTLTNKPKFSALVAALPEIAASYANWSALGPTLTVHLNADFTAEQGAALDAFVSGFVDFTTAESLSIYLSATIHPFVEDLITTFAAENISMGITQAEKTTSVLGLFTKKYDVENNGLPIALKEAFDTGSLYSAISILNYVRATPSEFDGTGANNLTPFITGARLLSMLNKIETFLGIALTI